MEFSFPAREGKTRLRVAAAQAINGETIDGCVLVAGGDMAQENSRPIRLGDAAQLFFRAGTDSHDNTLPAQSNRGAFRRNGQDVTASVVRGPG